MSNLIYEYLNQRLHHERFQSIAENHRPDKLGSIITISRQAGCAGKDIGLQIQRTINRNIHHPEDRWRCIDKDMMRDSAKKLDLPVRKIKYIFHGQKKSNMDEIFESLSSRYHKSDKVIRRTIVDVMKAYVKKGNIVIIGRAGVALAPFANRSFNIRLVASLPWRIKQISLKHEITDDEARKYIVEVDKKRMAMIEEFSGRKMEEAMFDIIYNCEHFSKNEIVQSCVDLLRTRALVH